jgi:tRNA A-37 threonylcarbamoyl transferase component Bud32
MTSEELALKQAEEKAWNDGALDRALNNLRTKRNTLLAKTDWTSSSDLTMSDAMKTYRQQLRDATESLDTVEKVQAYEFPTEVLK